MARVFWMVWNSGPDGRLPQYRHETIGGAMNEAKRLARLHRGQEFFVLQATHNVIVDPVTVTRLTEPSGPMDWPDEQIPF